MTTINNVCGSMIGVGVLRRIRNGIYGFYLKLSSQNVNGSGLRFLTNAAYLLHVVITIFLLM